MAAPVEHLEAVLKHPERENYNPPGSYCGCLQDVDIQGHLPRCIIHQASTEIEEWRHLKGLA
jgi:hypothetical protein